MTYLVVVVLIIMAIGGLLFTQRVAQKEQEKRIMQSKCKRLLERADDVLDTAKMASSYIKDNDVIDALFKFYIYYINQRQQLLPQTDTPALLAQAETYKKELCSNSIIAELKDDNEIKRCKQSFSKSVKILSACANKNFIDGETFNRMKHNLKFTLLQLEVNAYERLGDIAGEKKNPAVATNYYKYAKKMLIESDINFDDKHEHIREITRKNQLLFGNIVQEKIEQQIENENAAAGYGFSKDSNTASGQTKTD